MYIRYKAEELFLFGCVSAGESFPQVFLQIPCPFQPFPSVSAGGRAARASFCGERSFQGYIFKNISHGSASGVEAFQLFHPILCLSPVFRGADGCTRRCTAAQLAFELAKLPAPARELKPRPCRTQLNPAVHAWPLRPSQPCRQGIKQHESEQ